MTIRGCWRGFVLLDAAGVPILTIQTPERAPMQSTNHTSRATTQQRPVKASGWMVAALAMHLLVASMASAASTCSETIERTRVTRISHSVAQAIRDLVDHQQSESVWVVRDAEDAPIGAMLSAGDDHAESGSMLHAWLLNLPPPSA